MGEHSCQALTADHVECIFDQNCKAVPVEHCASVSDEYALDETGFQSALCESHPRLSADQAAAIWAHTGSSYMIKNVFCDIVNKVSKGDQAAADYANLELKAFKALRKSTISRRTL